ncbi:hypothetical protein [Ornithinimicrobium kibberense]|uniref:hypothetical protein n=1 Tax=Ornithinimicrobium kibberense TaxID=282060 RepID=UPI00362304E3
MGSCWRSLHVTTTAPSLATRMRSRPRRRTCSALRLQTLGRARWQGADRGTRSSHLPGQAGGHATCTRAAPYSRRLCRTVRLR